MWDFESPSWRRFDPDTAYDAFRNHYVVKMVAIAFAVVSGLFVFGREALNRPWGTVAVIAFAIACVILYVVWHPAEEYQDQRRERRSAQRSAREAFGSGSPREVEPVGMLSSSLAAQGSDGTAEASSLWRDDELSLDFPELEPGSDEGFGSEPPFENPNPDAGEDEIEPETEDPGSDSGAWS